MLQAIEEHALTPEAVEQVIQLTERDDVREQQEMLERENADIDRRVQALIAAIESGGDAASLVARLRQLEERQVAIVGEIAALRPVPRLPAAVVADRLADWRRLLRRSPTQGRAVIQRIVKGRIVFTPAAFVLGGEINSYTFEAPTRFDKLFSGVASPRHAFITPGGTAGRENIGPNEGFEDYGRLLELAERRLTYKRSSSPTGTANGCNLPIVGRAA